MIDNVITVTIGNSRKITSRPVWLTDKGMILKFVGIELPNYYVVDFARSVTDEALPVIGDAEGVSIPSELFHNADKIFAWLRITNGDNSHYTAYQVTIPLLQRSEISGSQPTPEQEDIIDQAIAALNEAGSEAAAAAESAAQSAAEIDAKLGGGGITGEEYVTLFGGEFTVTTATDAEHEHPYADTGIAGNFDKRYFYRVTFDGVEYVLPCQFVVYESADTVQQKSCVGNIDLYRFSMTDLLDNHRDVPFLVVSDKDGTSSNTIIVYSEDAGEHTVLVEKVTQEFSEISSPLIYGEARTPFQFTPETNQYESFSMGCNKIPSSARFAYALGYGNEASQEGAIAVGVLNHATGYESAAIGYSNIASNAYAVATGLFTNATGNSSRADGRYTTAGATCSHAEGEANQALALGSHVEGGGNVANSSQKYTHILGVNSNPTDETGKTVTVTRRKRDGTVGGTATHVLGKYAEVVGNGNSEQDRSNARTLDWDGNEGLAGGLTLGMGTEDEIHITPAQLKALLNLI